MRPDSPAVSVIVPVRGDSGPLARLLDDLRPHAGTEIIVSNTGEPDRCQRDLRTSRPDVTWVDGPPGRGAQLNAGGAAAAGRWLWFVHADSRLPLDWLDVFRELEDMPSVVGGSFAFRLDSSAWQARWLERGVALRVRWFGLPYGDQGIFARRDVFTLMQGFSPMPLMEDVDFVRRLKRRGRMRHLNIGLLTSARRWEREGWGRRSAANVVTLAAYFAGVSPARLARGYYRGTPTS